MAAIVQSVYVVDDTGTASLTIAGTITGVGLNAVLAVHLGWEDVAGTTTISGVNDGTAYAIADVKRRDTSNLQGGMVWYLKAASAGSHTVTATLSASESFRRMRIVEMSGLDTAAPLDQAVGAFQSAPGTGANAVSSGASTATTNANDLVVGFSQDTAEADPGSGTVTAGSGYIISGSNIILSLESQSVSATGAQTATFTQSVNNNRITHVVAFKQTGGVIATTPSFLKMLGPGQKPGGNPPLQVFKPGVPVITNVAAALTGTSISSTSAYASALQTGVLNGQSIAGTNAFAQLLGSGSLSGQSVTEAVVFGSGLGTGALASISVSGTTAFASITGAGALSGQSITGSVVYGAALGAGSLSGQSITGSVVYGNLQALSNGSMTGISITSTTAFASATQAGVLAGQSITGTEANGALLGAGQLTGVSITSTEANGAALGSGALSGVSITGTLANASGTQSGVLTAQSITTTVVFGDLQGTSPGSMFGIAIAHSTTYASGDITIGMAPIVEATGSVPGFVPGGKPKKSKKRRDIGPVMREGQVFGEEYPISPFATSAQPKVTVTLEPSVSTEASQEAESWQAAVIELLRELL